MNNTDNQTPTADNAAPTEEIANRPLSQLALMYKAIESLLRRGKYMTVPQIRHTPDIAKIEQNPWQVKSILRTLDKHGLIEHTGKGRNAAVRWKQDAPPFILPLKIEQKAAREPSIPRNIDTPFNPDGTRKDAPPAAREAVLPGAPQVPQKALELVVNGFIILIDQNPTTGNDRIVIERIWEQGK